MATPAPVAETISKGPQPGDIVLFSHATGVNRIITLITRSKYYHAAVFSGGSHVVEARPKGIIDRDVNGPEGTRYNAFISASEGKGSEALAWARSQIGGKYDRVDILVMLLERVFRHLRLNYAPPGKFTCGEFVARAYQESGVKLFDDLKPEEVVPGDFERLGPVLLPSSGVENH